MKKIEAVIQPEALESVKEALFEAEVHKMTVHRVRGCGQQRGYTESYRGKVYKVNLLEKIKIEIDSYKRMLDIRKDSVQVL